MDQEPQIKEIDIIARAEADRKRKTLIKGVAGLIFLILLGVGLYQLAGTLGGNLDVVAAEEESVERTDDPQCRALIAEVGALGDDYKSRVAKMELVLSEDVEQVKAARAEISAMREELERLRVSSKAANLRFKQSRKELDEWFTYINNELGFLDRRADVQLKVLDAKTRGETYVEPVKKPARRIVGRDAQKQRSPAEKRDAIVLAIHDAFQNFRVWHTGAMHPCGEAAADETPWRPAPSAAETPPKP